MSNLTMCEIAVFPTDSDRLDSIVEAAKVLYEENPHAFGAVAVYPNEEQEQFSYAFYKATAPTWDNKFRAFLEQNTGAWRLVLHARFATTGDNTVNNAHPLILDCEQTEVDAIVHNGVVRDHAEERKELEDDGHEFTTGVDSEVIAHKHGNVPDSLDDMDEAPDVSGSLNYLLFAENGILVRTTRKYNVTEDFRVTCGARFGMKKSEGKRGGWRLFTPDKDSEYARLRDKRKSLTTRTRRTTTTTASSSVWGWRGADDGEENDDTRSASRSRSLSGGYWAEAESDEDDSEEDERPVSTSGRTGTPDGVDKPVYGADDIGFCEGHEMAYAIACPACIEDYHTGDTDEVSHEVDEYDEGQQEALTNLMEEEDVIAEE